MLRRQFLATTVASLSPGKTLRVAIIGHTGLGGYGHDWEYTFDTVPGTSIVAAADADEAGRTSKWARLGTEHVYTDYHEMISREKPDVVGIFPRAAGERLPMFTAAAAGGAHVLMEKPFAPTLPVADSMLALARKHHMKVQVGHTARLMPVTVAARRMLEQGAIGQLLEIRSRGKEDRRAGGEDMMVLGTHVFDLMRYFAGDPRWVFAQVTDRGRDISRHSARQASEPVGPVAGDNVAAMFGFDRGVHGYFGSAANDVPTGKRFGVTLYGSRGLMFVPLTNVPSEAPYLLVSASWVGDGWKRIEAPAEATLRTRLDVNRLMAADLVQSIRSNTEPACGAADGHWTNEMLTGIYQSHLMEKRLAFPLQDRSDPFAAPA